MGRKLFGGVTWSVTWTAAELQRGLAEDDR
jgi:hypothetical protein